jgi:hypothetical protein
MDYGILAATGLFMMVCVVGGAFIMVKAGTRDVSDKERVALFRAGAFQRLAGPGKVFAMPLLDRAVPIAIDDVGTALVEGRAQFGGVDIPIKSSVLLESGDMVRIIGFDREEAAVVLRA